MAKPSQAQVREINRTLLATVRADWTYPPPARSKKRARDDGRMAVEPLSYRQRYYSTSDGERDGSSASESTMTESSDDDTVEASWSSPETEKELNPLDEAGASAAVERDGQLSRRTSRKQTKKRRFETPADVAAYLECKTERRRRRRLQAMAEELKWNDGLRHFTQRRNAWTCALTEEEMQQKKEQKERREQQAQHEQQDAKSSKDESVACAVSVPLSNVTERKDSTSSASNGDDTGSSTAESPSAARANKQLHTGHPAPSSLATDHNPGSVFSDEASSSPSSADMDPLALLTVHIPIAIPILPSTHPVRASVMSRSPADLYDKIVRDGRTPAVPLNLALMMSVIVQGWKDEGNWPPKAALAEAGLLASTRAVANAGGAAGKRRGLRARHSAAPTTAAGPAAAPPLVGHTRAVSESKIAGLFEGHKHLQRGVESVRRAFRLSGSGPSAGE